MKTYAALYAEMKQHYCEKTGFSMADTADLAVRLSACAAQLEGALPQAIREIMEYTIRRGSK